MSDPVEVLARALFEQSAKGLFGPYDAVINARLRAGFEHKARAILAQITPALVAEAVAEEREACAKVAESIAPPMDGKRNRDIHDYTSRTIASYIRNRSKT